MGPRRRNRLQLSGAIFYTENENVIFVVDATAVPPIFNQDDGQIVKGAAFALLGQSVPRWDVNLSLAVSGLPAEQPESGQQRQASDPDPGIVVQPLDHRSSGARYPRRRRPALYGSGVHQRRQYHPGASLHGRGRTHRGADRPQLTLRLNIYNLTDRTYIRSINNNGGRYNPGTPRSFLLSTAVRF